MHKTILALLAMLSLSSQCIGAADPPSSAHCGAVLSDATRHRCLRAQLDRSDAALAAATAEMKAMMARWENAPLRARAQANFDATIAEFARYRRVQCEYFASMRYGVAQRDEIEIVRLKCMLELNEQRTKAFTDMTRTIVI